MLSILLISMSFYTFFTDLITYVKDLITNVKKTYCERTNVTNWEGNIFETLRQGGDFTL